MNDEPALSREVDRLRTLVTRFCDVPAERIGAATRFDELPSWGSLPALQLLAAVEKECPVDFEVREFLLVETVGALAEQILLRSRQPEPAPEERPAAVPVEA